MVEYNYKKEIQERGIKMRKNFTNLRKAINKTSEILDNNRGIKWGDLVGLLVNDEDIYPYYDEIVDLILIGKEQERLSR